LLTLPPDAEVWDLRTGRILCRTPCVIEPVLFPRSLCLKRMGFQDQVLTIQSRSELPKDAVLLQKKTSPRTEDCDVPIPIL
jgi:hypothetical protein